jgi:cold shock CspA family protein
MQAGTIKFLACNAHFAFIRPDDGGDDVFAHDSGFADAADVERVEVGDRVSYEVTPSKNKPGTFCGVNLRLLDAAPDAPIKCGS